MAIDVAAEPTSTAHLFPADARIHRLSTSEYERMVGTGALEGLRVELLDGLLIDMSPQDPQHAWTILQLTQLCAERAALLRVQLPLDVADGWVPEPDVALAESNPRHHPKTALLVVEVAFSSKRVDTGKALVYAHAAVPTYWLVDLPARTVIVHTRPGPNGYASIEHRNGDDVLDAGVEGVPHTTVAALLAL